MKAIINVKLVTLNGVIENKVLVFNETIQHIQTEVPIDCEVIDAKGIYIAPG